LSHLALLWSCCQAFHFLSLRCGSAHPNKKASGTRSKSSSSSTGNVPTPSDLLQKVEEDTPPPEPIKTDRRAKVNTIDGQSKTLFDIAGKAARSEDGEESIIDRVMLDQAAEQKKDNGSPIKQQNN
jgi:hypothetical protein